MRCPTSVLIGFLALSTPLVADIPVAKIANPDDILATPVAVAAPAVDTSLPRSYRDFHLATSTSLTFLSPKNLHHEVNAIFKDNWEIPSTTASKISGLVQLGGDNHLARVTAYWPGEPNDPYTTMHMSSTGVHLHVGHCAVDPKVIPYNSVVQIPGVGIFLAVDTGSAVVSREAAKASASTVVEKSALVIDLYFNSQSDGQRFATHGPTFSTICWWAPTAMSDEAKLARSLVAGQEWTRVYGKQLASARP